MNFYKFPKHAIKIQAVWRSYYKRKKINMLFVNLPHDLQNLVLYFMRKEQRQINLHKSYAKIYYNKIYKLNIGLSELYYHYQTIYSMDFEDYISRKIIITDKITYYKIRLNEII